MEIERKFLVADDRFLSESVGSYNISQGYFPVEGLTIRIRLRDEEAFLTIKTPSLDGGLSREEYEYPIPYADGLALLERCSYGRLEKRRYLVPYKGYTWEVDVFEGKLSGLLLAEVELEDFSEQPPLPPWLGEEVTGRGEYTNSFLSKLASM